MSQDGSGTNPDAALIGPRVAFFGGSFDPPHLGHLAVARAARAACRLNEVLFAPVGAQALKPEGSVASFDDRLAMTKLAIQGEPGFAISLADAPKAGGEPNFTLETLQRVRTGLGGDGILFCLMGADSIFGLRRWHRAVEIPFVATLIVASRPGEPLEELQSALPEGLKLKATPNAERNESGVEVAEYRILNAAGDCAPFYVLPGLHVEISATEIRRKLREGAQGTRRVSQAGQDVLPDAVAEYVREHGLYK
jgi:nicotinate-nucleotide adenylyltransferase